MKKENALIVFQKNEVLGKVKSRLAVTIGEEKALNVYRMLLDLTYSQVAKLSSSDIFVYYSDEIGDRSFHFPVTKRIQKGQNLGHRMAVAFEEVFLSGYQKTVIIGTDCPEISAELLEQAFGVLDQKDAVIGPALDGGYYLLGMCRFNESLFQNMPWSSSEVTAQTIEKLNLHKISFGLLKTLRDIDTEEDLTTIFPK